MFEKHGDRSSNRKLERPLECSECKRPIMVKYTEIIGGNITQTGMCSECPELQRRLHGTPTAHFDAHDSGTGVACGNCGTTLESVQMGNPLGCSLCYEVFGNVLFNELINENKISPRVATSKKSAPLHIGRAPGEALEINPSLRLLALNEALTETLKREDYEQAALLRDQIKALTKDTENENEKQ